MKLNDIDIRGTNIICERRAMLLIWQHMHSPNVFGFWLGMVYVWATDSISFWCRLPKRHYMLQSNNNMYCKKKFFFRRGFCAEILQIFKNRFLLMKT